MRTIFNKTVGISLLSAICLLCAPVVRATNWVVDGLNGDDANTGESVDGDGGPNAGPNDEECGDDDLDYHRKCLDFSPGTALATIGVALDKAEDGDFIFVKDGVYAETVNIAKRLTLVAVGEVIITGVSPGFDAENADGLVIDGFTIQNCGMGVNISNCNETKIKNLTVRNCNDGIFLSFAHQTIIRRCIITDCGDGIYFNTMAAQTDIYRCTLVANGGGIDFHGVGTGGIVQNSIMANNNNFGIRSYTAIPMLHFNAVYGNGLADYDGLSAGINDVSVDAAFVDEPRRILHLQSGSLLINAGEELGGGPAVTIGAREVGQFSSNAVNAWSGWVWLDADVEVLVESCPLQTAGDVCIDDAPGGTGHLILKPGTVTEGKVLSPVYDGSLKSVNFAAVEDLSALSGNRRAIDDDDTFQRELVYYGWDAGVDPAEQPSGTHTIFEGQVIDRGYAKCQIELRLTVNAK